MNREDISKIIEQMLTAAQEVPFVITQRPDITLEGLSPEDVHYMQLYDMTGAVVLYNAPGDDYRALFRQALEAHREMMLQGLRAGRVEFGVKDGVPTMITAPKLSDDEITILPPGAPQVIRPAGIKSTAKVGDSQ